MPPPEAQSLAVGCRVPSTPVSTDWPVAKISAPAKMFTNVDCLSGQPDGPGEPLGPPSIWPIDHAAP